MDVRIPMMVSLCRREARSGRVYFVVSLGFVALMKNLADCVGIKENAVANALLAGDYFEAIR
jgi:hypothetical protein